MYLAEHVKLHTLRAVKCVEKSKVPYERQIKEAFFLKSLRHPSIPVLYDVEEDEQYFYLLEEYIEGESIKSMLHRQKQFSPDEIIIYGIQICEVICYLHSQKPYPIIHGDIAPGNIMVKDQQCYLLDFGNAIQITGKEVKGDSYGTLEFIAPEQQKERSCNVQVDIYGVCALLRAMCLTCKGRTLLTGANLRQLYKVADKGIREQGYEDIHELQYRLLELKGQSLTSKYQVNQIRNSVGITIGCIGTTPGCGVTSISLWLAQTLGRQARVAVVQYGQQKELGRYKLWQQQQGICVETIRNGFRCEGIDFYPMTDSQVLLYILNVGYEIVVLDFGQIGQREEAKAQQEIIKEFQQCNRKIILGNYCTWNYEPSLRTLEGLMDGMYTRDWIYGSLSNDDTVCNLLEHKLGVHILRSTPPKKQDLQEKILHKVTGYSKGTALGKVLGKSLGGFFGGTRQKG